MFVTKTILFVVVLGIFLVPMLCCFGPWTDPPLYSGRLIFGNVSVCGKFTEAPINICNGHLLAINDTLGRIEKNHVLITHIFLDQDFLRLANNSIVSVSKCGCGIMPVCYKIFFSVLGGVWVMSTLIVMFAPYCCWDVDQNKWKKMFYKFKRLGTTYAV